ncbi:MAG: hypothetical protein N4A72_12835 [Bacteroidales bacterium]|nr:hypothetical protein [Bacteroidales bacterium]
MIKKLIKNISPELFKKYLIVFGFSFLGAIINVWLLRFIYHSIGEESMLHYTYARRVVTFASTILLLGLGVALPRYIGRSDFDKNKSKQLLASSMLPVVFITSVWFLLNTIFPELFTSLIWGELTENTVKLNRVVTLYVIGLNMHGVIHSYYRGKQSVFSAGILELFSLALIPLFSAIGATDLIELYYFMAVGTLICMGGLLIKIINKNSFNEFSSNIKLLLSYGIRRVPGDIAWAVFVILPPYFATKFIAVDSGGIVSLGITFVNLAAIAPTAISFIALSRSASMIKTDRHKLKREFSTLTIGMLAYSVALILFLNVFMTFIIEMFFDNNMLPHVSIIKRITWAIGPFVVFTLFRSLIDAAFKRPYMSYYSIISVIIFCLYMFLNRDDISIENIVNGMNLSYFCLAGLCIYRVIRIFRVQS